MWQQNQHTTMAYVSSAVIMGTDEWRDNDTNDEKWGDIWREAPETRIHKEDDIHEADDKDKPFEEEANMAWGCEAKNYSNCSNIYASTDVAEISSVSWGELGAHRAVGATEAMVDVVAKVIVVVVALCLCSTRLDTEPSNAHFAYKR